MQLHTKFSQLTFNCIQVYEIVVRLQLVKDRLNCTGYDLP